MFCTSPQRRMRTTRTLVFATALAVYSCGIASLNLCFLAGAPKYHRPVSRVQRAYTNMDSGGPPPTVPISSPAENLLDIGKNAAERLRKFTEYELEMGGEAVQRLSRFIGSEFSLEKPKAQKIIVARNADFAREELGMVAASVNRVNAFVRSELQHADEVWDVLFVDSDGNEAVRFLKENILQVNSYLRNELHMGDEAVMKLKDFLAERVDEGEAALEDFDKFLRKELGLSAADAATASSLIQGTSPNTA